MHVHDINGREHDHLFLGERHDRNEYRAKLVIGLSAVMMVAEVAAGILLGSMALLADGLHMATHAGALAIAAAAYSYARRHQNNPRFAFGTGKLGDLAAFGSAVVLGIAALMIAWESLKRLATPVEIEFGEAIAVATVGLLVNLAGAWLLHDSHHHDHGGEPVDHHHDHNHRAAYLHVLADALTSLLAIVGLLVAMFVGWTWIDPVVGLLGGLVIGRWSLQLMQDSGAVLVDAAMDPAVAAAIRRVLEAGDDRVIDLHVWRVGPGHTAAILSVISPTPRAPEEYKARLRHLSNLCHVTVEVHSAR